MGIQRLAENNHNRFFLEKSFFPKVIGGACGRGMMKWWPND